jgi:hypothetical protein
MDDLKVTSKSEYSDLRLNKVEISILRIPRIWLKITGSKSKNIENGIGVVLSLLEENSGNEE